MSAVSAFPRRPLRLAWLPSTRPDWRGLLAMALFLFGLIADILVVVPPLIDDVTVGRGGKLAAQATVAPGGKCEISRGVLTDCSFEAVFKTDAANEVHKSLRYFALFDSIDDKVPFRVYYDAADPQRISTSWGQALLTNRLISQVLALALIAVVLVGLPLLYVRNLQLRRSLLAVATAPRPVVADFIKLRSDRRSASVLFAWTDPDSGVKRRDRSRLPVTSEPFWLDAQRKTLLALAGPDGRAHALDERLWPAILSEEERATLRQAARASIQ